MSRVVGKRALVDEGYVRPPERRVDSPAVSGHAAPGKVLVLDDEPSIRLLCRVVLELEGFEIVEASSVREAREAVAAGGVAVVVVDLNLRGERSVDLIAECHACEPRIPVVLVTGSVELGGEGTPEADAVLGKPFETEDLVAAVRALAGASR